jgi:L-serine deaminase
MGFAAAAVVAAQAKLHRLSAALPAGNLGMLPHVATETEKRNGKSEKTN